MTKEHKDHGAYVKRVREETQRYVQELLADNDRLRQLIAHLETDQRRQETENHELRDKVLRQEQELERFRNDHARLARRLSDIEQENVRYSSEFVGVEQRNNDLANLYVASYRLHGTLDRQEVLTVIKEIVVNLIGCEEFGIYERSEHATELELIGAMGLPEDRYRKLPLERGLIGRAAQTGAMFLGDDGEGVRLEEERDLTACVPLLVDRQVIAMIALFRLLPQKCGRLAPIDRELFDLLATQAAQAVYCTTLHARYGVSGAVA